MFGRLRSPIAIAASLVAVGTLAISAAASPASATTVGPHQYFVGQVYGLSSSTSNDVITVACVGPETLGHPFANQYVAVQEIFPPITSATAGYTGSSATEINADLTWGTTGGPVTIAAFTQYSVKEEIPTSVLVPCGGSGTMSFNPEPDVAGTSSLVGVTFVSPGA